MSQRTASEEFTLQRARAVMQVREADLIKNSALRALRVEHVVETSLARTGHYAHE
jgi:hypothetical protein